MLRRWKKNGRFLQMSRGHNADRMRGLFSLRTVLILMGCLASAGATGAVTEALKREYEVKAAFLFNFAKYGQWPAAQLGVSSFRFCIADGADVMEILTSHLGQRRLHELPVQVSLLGNVAEPGCHVVFLTSAVSNAQQKAMLNAYLQQPVLLVGEATEFLQLGGAIRLFIASGTVHFEVNLDNLQRQQLQLSSKLLRHADRVIGRPRESEPSASDPGVRAPDAHEPTAGEPVAGEPPASESAPIKPSTSKPSTSDLSTSDSSTNETSVAGQTGGAP